MDDNIDRTADSQSQALQTYILTPVESDTTSQEPLVDLGRLVRAIWRWKLVILLVPVIVATLLFLIRYSRSDRYAATATLVVQRSLIDSELEPQSLGIETYQTLLTSDAVLSKLKIQLVEAGLIARATTLESLKARLNVELVANKAVDRAGQRTYLPMLRLLVEGDTPELAEKTANNWAALFIDEVRELARSRKQDALDFVEDRFPGVSENLRNNEAKLNSTRDENSSELVETSSAWQERILKTSIEQGQREMRLRAETERTELDFEVETARLTTQHQIETEKLKRDFLSSWQREIRLDERAVKRNKLNEFKDRLLDVQVRLQEKKENLKQLESEIAKHPEFIVLSKAISDDALWQKVGQNAKDAGLRDLADVKFESQSLNPVYQSLLGQLTTTKVDLNTLVPTEVHLREEIESLETELVVLEDTFSAQNLAYEALVTRRTEEYQNLVRRREVELAILRRENEAAFRDLSNTGALRLAQLEQDRDRQLEQLNWDSELAVEQIGRETESLKETYKLMASRLEAARLARSDEVPDVQLAVPAVRPDEPLEKKSLIWAVAGFFISLVAIFSFVLIMETARPYLTRDYNSAEVNSRASARTARGQVGVAGESGTALRQNLVKN